MSELEDLTPQPPLRRGEGEQEEGARVAERERGAINRAPTGNDPSVGARFIAPSDAASQSALESPPEAAPRSALESAPVCEVLPTTPGAGPGAGAPSGWELLARFEGGTISALTTALAAEDTHHVFAATPVGVFRSTDRGRSWQPLGGSSRVPGVEVVAPSPRYANDGTVFAGALGGLYRWRNTLGDWEHLLSGSRVLSVAVVAGEGTSLTVLAGTETDGILLSHDSGQTWSGANAGLLDLEVLALAISPAFADDGLAFAGTPTALYRTRNGGESWRQIELLSEGEDIGVQCFALSTGFPENGIILVGTLDRLGLRSDDRGRSWEELPDLADCDTFSIASLTGGQMVAATDRGVARSDDDGVSWRLVGTDLEGVVSATALVDGAESVLLAGVADTGIVRSEDGGETWAPANDGLAATTFVGLLLSPDFERDRTMYAQGLQTYCGISEDGGQTWTMRNDDLEAEVDCRKLPGGRWAFSWEPDAAWQDLTMTVPAGEVVAVAVAPDAEDNRAAGIHVVTVGRPGSADPGLTVWRTTDRGRRWDRWLELPDVPFGTAVRVVALPPNRWDDTVVVGYGDRVLRPRQNAWENRGGARRPVWDAANLPVEGGATRLPAITGLVASPDYPQDRTLFSATSSGVYVSRDGGATFAPWNDGLEPLATVAVVPSPAYARDRLVFALGLGGTLWRRQDD